MKTADLVGKKVVDYNENIGIVVASCKFKNWRKLNSYDGSGWLGKKCWKEYGLKKSDKLVAVEDEEGNHNVYVFGNGGVELIESNEN
jgi:hypothetical protein